MAGPTNVAWEDVSIRVFVDGEEKGLYAAVDFSARAELNPRSAKYQGDPIPKKDSSYNGWSGSLTFELREGYDHPKSFINPFLEGVKQRTATGHVRMIVTHRDPDGSSTALRLERLQLTPEIRVSENERLRIPVSFEAEDGVLS